MRIGVNEEMKQDMNKTQLNSTKLSFCSINGVE
jgi:hypothetical protein